MEKLARYFIALVALLIMNQANATTYYSKTSGGNWNDITTWSTAGYGQSTNSGTYPKTGDSACIGDSYSVYVNFSPTCGVLYLGQGTSGTVEFSSSGNYTLTIQNNLVVNAGAKLWYNGNSSRSHTLVEGGSIINNGDIDFYSDANDVVNITFNRTTNASVSGGGTFDLNNVVLNKSTSSAYTIDIQSSTFEAAIKDLTLSYGTYYHNNNSSFQVNPSGSSFIVNSDVVVKVSQGQLHLSPNSDDLTLSGSLVVTGGILKIGSSSGAGGIKYDKVGAFTPRMDVQGGTLDIYGGCTYKTGASTDPVYFTMTGGTVYLNTGSIGTSGSVFNLNDVAGSNFVMGGGSIILSQNNITGTSVNDFSVCCSNGSVSVGGGTVQFGDENTTDNTTFTFVPSSSVILPSIKITGSSLYAATLQPGNNSTDNIKALSLSIDYNKSFDIQSASGSTNNSRSLILTSTIDGVVGFNNDGTFNNRTGTLLMLASEAQQISGSSLYSLNNLTINNSMGIQVSSNMEIAGTLTLTNGLVSIVNTGSIQMLTGSSNSLGSSSSFIDGSFSVAIASSLDATINFPIGKDGTYKPVSMTVRNSTSSPVAYTAEMINSSAGNLSYIIPASIDKVSAFRYYTFSRVGSDALVTASITIYYDTDDGVTDESNLRLASFDGTSSWIDEGGAGTSSPSGSITVDGITSLRAIYALGNNVGGSNPLPVNWLSFDAKRNGNNIHLTWATASESEADYYSIERSVDGLNYEEVGKVMAMGTTSQISTYHFVDDFYLPLTLYYRLKQVDVNGHFFYTAIRTVLTNSKISNLSFYPNPVTDNHIHIDLGNRSFSSVNVYMYSSSGYVCAGTTYTDCKNVINIDLPNNMKSGYYKFVCYDNNDNKIADSGVIVE